VSLLSNPQLEQKLLAIVAEEGRVLGASKARALLDSLGLQGDDFSERPARLVFEAFAAALPRGLAPVREALESELLRLGGERVAWRNFAPCFSPVLATSAEALALAVALKNLASRRRAYEAARRIIALAETGEAVGPELAQEMHHAANTVPGHSSAWRGASQGSDAASKRIRAVQDGRILPNVPTGYPEIDGAIGGIHPTLVVLCGRAGVVKSGIAASVLRNVARRGQVGAIFSLEDREEWLGFRYLAHASGIPQFVLRNRPLTEGQWFNLEEAKGHVHSWDSRILVDDRPGLKPAEILLAAREAYAERGASIVVVDNMTAVRFGRGDRRDLDVQDFLSGGRELADEFKAPFVVIAHTHNREGTKPDALPRLADCREAPGAFENLARLALGVAKAPDEDFVRLGVLKNQNGKTSGDTFIKLPFHQASGLLADPEAEPVSQESLL